MEINQLLQRLKHGEQYTVMVGEDMELVQQLVAPTKYTRKAAMVIEVLNEDNQKLIQQATQLSQLLAAAHAECEQLRKPTTDIEHDETRL